MRRGRRAGAFTSVVAAGILAAVAVPSPALAATTCSGNLGLNPQTVGVLGRPVATTPEFHVSVCVTVPDGLTTPPTLEYKLSGPYWIVELVNADGAGTNANVTVTYSANNSGDTESVSVPVPLTNTRTCLFFLGDVGYNPGGCVAFIEN